MDACPATSSQATAATVAAAGDSATRRASGACARSVKELVTRRRRESHARSPSSRRTSFGARVATILVVEAFTLSLEDRAREAGRGQTDGHSSERKYR